MVGKKQDDAAKQRSHEKKMQAKQHKHESRMALIELFKEDPTWFYKIGAMTGSLVTAGAAVGATVKPGHNDVVFPKGLDLPGFSKTIFVGGLTFTTWCYLQLTIPTMFGPDGLQIKTSVSGFGFDGDVEIG